MKKETVRYIKAMLGERVGNALVDLNQAIDRDYDPGRVSKATQDYAAARKAEADFDEWMGENK